MAALPPRETPLNGAALNPAFFFVPTAALSIQGGIFLSSQCTTSSFAETGKFLSQQAETREHGSICDRDDKNRVAWDIKTRTALAVK